MAPTVTVAIPLHASGRWVDNVVANVRALPSMVAEIIVSDQTCVDDAADRLRLLLADDPRVVIRAEPAGLGFVEHYHELLEIGRGELFMWMPHDDVFDPGWVPILAAALDAHPRAWLAFGQLHRVQIDGSTPHPASRPLLLPPGEISGWSALLMMLGGQMWVPFRGLFRRREVLAADLRMHPELAYVGVDVEWVFAVALRSALVYDDRAITWKRMYAGSTHTLPSWRRRVWRGKERATLAGLRRRGPGGVKGVAMRSVTQLAWLVPRSAFNPTTRRAVTWVLAQVDRLRRQELGESSSAAAA